MVVCLKKNRRDLKGEGNATELVKSLQVFECGAVDLAIGFYWCRFAWDARPGPAPSESNFSFRADYGLQDHTQTWHVGGLPGSCKT
jgi:hypothetical protein